MERDFLGEGFERETFHLEADEEGEVIAVLVRKKCKTRSKKAVLYIHGFMDYFFNTEMADRFTEAGFHFYALDLRKYGRALLPHQRPNFCKDVCVYFEEIDKALEFIIEHDGNGKVSLGAHSIGGLIAALYTEQTLYKRNITSLFLNSPFLEFNASWIKKKILAGILENVGKLHPYAEVLSELPDFYMKSIHKDYFGEWDFNLCWRPLKGFPVCLGWICAIHKAHKIFQKGLHIDCPVIVMSSKESSKVRKWEEVVGYTDCVLEVEDINKYSDVL